MARSASMLYLDLSSSAEGARAAIAIAAAAFLAPARAAPQQRIGPVSLADAAKAEGDQTFRSPRGSADQKPDRQGDRLGRGREGTKPRSFLRARREQHPRPGEPPALPWLLPGEDAHQSIRWGPLMRETLVSVCGCFFVQGDYYLSAAQKFASPGRDRHRPRAGRTEQPHREAVPLRPGLSSNPRAGGLGPLSVDSTSPFGAGPLRPKPSEALPPIPFRLPCGSAVVSSSGRSE